MTDPSSDKIRREGDSDPGSQAPGERSPEEREADRHGHTVQEHKVEKAKADKHLDHGLEETFPASDPVSISPGAD